MARTAREVNDDTAAQRGRAAKGQSANLDVVAQQARAQGRRDEARDIAETVIELQRKRQIILDNIAEIRMGAKAITKGIATEYDKAEGIGFVRQCFKDMIELLKKDADQRLAYEASRKELVKGFGFESGEQIDAFLVKVDADLEASPSGELKHGQADAIAAHLDRKSVV